MRDPRDGLVSLAFYIDKIMDAYLNGKVQNKAPCHMSRSDCLNWKKLNFDEKLMYAIKSEKAFGYDFSWAVSKQWELASKHHKKLLQGEKFLILTKFEDLIGAKGQGSTEKQFNEIKKITRFLGLNLSDSKIKSVQKNYWGGTHTFFKGQIGKWKLFFKPNHIKEFLPRFQRYLEEFGYEKNADWAKPYLAKEV